MHEQGQLTRVDGQHLADPPDTGDGLLREGVQRRIECLERHEPGRQRGLDPRTLERPAEPAGGDLDLG